MKRLPKITHFWSLVEEGFDFVSEILEQSKYVDTVDKSRV